MVVWSLVRELVAQLVEQCTFNAWVLGSSPSELTTYSQPPPPKKSAHHYCLVKCADGTARSRSAAPSAVMSRWGMPSISKPTMNFFTVAERSSGG